MSGHWRVGRSLGRTLYADDQLVGLMDSPELARQIVAVMNTVEEDLGDLDDYDELLAGIAALTAECRRREGVNWGAAIHCQEVRRYLDGELK